MPPSLPAVDPAAGGLAGPPAEAPARVCVVDPAAGGSLPASADALDEAPAANTAVPGGGGGRHRPRAGRSGWRRIAGAGALAGAALLISSVLTPAGTIENDVGYYRAWAELAGQYGFAEVLREYPTPIMLLLWLPTLVVSTEASYRAVFVGVSLLLVAGGAATLALLPGGAGAEGSAGADGHDAAGAEGRRAHVLPAGEGETRLGRRRMGSWSPSGAGETAAVVLLLSVGALGPITLYRFDLLPGLLLAAGAVALARESRARTGSTAPGRRDGRAAEADGGTDASGAPGRRAWPWWSVCVALGAGIKLWPVVAWPLVLGDRPRRRREILGFVATGAALVLVSVAAAGWGRLLSPLTWQSGRGLQVESVLATWVLLARLVAPWPWSAALSEANSWDFTGPGIAATLVAGSIAQIALVAWIVVICVRLWRTRRADPLTVAVAAASLVGVFLVTDKVFSPQYMMWWAPIVAVACGWGRPTGAVPVWWAPTMILTCGLTQLSYPTTYGWLYAGDTGPWFLVGTLLMVVRNLAVVALTASACRRAWLLAAPASPSSPEGADHER